MRPSRNIFFVLGLVSVLVCAHAASALTQPPHWVASWAAAQQVPEPANALPVEALHDATARQIFRLSIGGHRLRVHLTNVYGTSPLHFTAVHIARPYATNSSAVDPATDRALTFAGQSDVVVPAGAEYLSDPVEYPVAALTDIAVSFHLDAPPSVETSHPGSRTTSYYMHGDQTAAAQLKDAQHVDHWFQVSAIDVEAAPGSAAIVALGDSITDGRGSTTNGNDRWTNLLAARLNTNPKTRSLAVVNLGLGGNCILSEGLGPTLVARFDRDALTPAGVRWLVIFEGVNDLGALALRSEASAADHAALVDHITAAYRQMIERAHTHGLQVYGATITPWVGSGYYKPSAANEADRQAVNAWIRAAGHFDAVVDFDRVLSDPAHPERLLPAYDSGDGLHPSPAGYKALAASIPLRLFAR
jgi:lysophospholipase L1-like esterase